MINSMNQCSNNLDANAFMIFQESEMHFSG